MVKLEVKKLTFGYDSKPVLKNFDLKLREGETLGVVGPNASGKSTLLKCINKFLEPDKGSIYIDGKSVEDLGRKEISRKIGHVPQQEVTSFPVTVFDMVLMGRKPYIDWTPSSKDLETVSRIIEKLGLQKQAMKDTNNLSGGQKQKVVIARALAQKPEILLLDEPTSNLDIKHQLDILDTVKKQAKNGFSVILAIHDLNLATKYCNKIMMLKNGEIYSEGGTEILKPENIEPVYNIKTTIVEKNGRKVIIPESNHKSIE